MIRTKLAVGALVSTLILSMCSSVVFAAPATSMDSITFKQTYVVSNNSGIKTTPELEPFTYSISNDVDTSKSSIPGVPVTKGDLSKVTLETTEINLDEEVDFTGTTFTKSYDINISLGEFNTAGIFRYSLNRTGGSPIVSTEESTTEPETEPTTENKVADKTIYFDVYVFNEDDQPVVISCNFYNEDFSEKLTMFSDAYEINPGDIITINKASIIRFEDQEGENIVDDIILTYDSTHQEKPKTIVKLGGKANGKLEGISTLRAVQSNLELGLATYTTTLATLQSSHYKLIKDEVAENLALENPVWFNFESDEQFIFHVVMQTPTIYKVRVSKVDYDDNSYLLKGAEFTVYRQDGTVVDDIDGNPCVGVTDKNGYLEFKIYAEENETYYIQETKAPSGYTINEKKFPITPTTTGNSSEENVTDVEILVEDKVIFIPPRTGDSFNSVYYTIITVISLSAVTCGIIYVCMQIKKKQEIQ